MIEEVRTGNPEFVVQVDSLDLWNYLSDGKPTAVSWWCDYGPKHYDLVGMVDIISEWRTEYRWGPAAALYKPESDLIVAVYKRREHRRSCRRFHLERVDRRQDRRCYW